jgi:hypothetical protein
MAKTDAGLDRRRAGTITGTQWGPEMPDFIGLELVLPERIELSTSPLPRGCSTTELRQQQRAAAKGGASAAETATAGLAAQGLRRAAGGRAFRVPIGHARRGIRRTGPPAGRPRFQ